MLIECAYFDPLRTAATGRKAGMQSDARYRFERGVDPAFIQPGLDLATAMMLEVAGGTPSKRKIAGEPPEPKTVISFAPAQVEKLGGIELPEDKQMRAHAGTLGFAIDGKGATVKVTAPSWRPDVHGPADLVEEVVRIAGLDKVPSAPHAALRGVARAVLTETQRRVRRARRALAARGLVEAITWSFISARQAQRVRRRPGCARARQPDLERDDLDAAEPAAGPAGRRAAQPQPRLRRSRPVRGRPGLSRRRPEDQLIAAAGVRAGASPLGGAGRHWSGTAEDAGLFDAKADVVALLAGLGFDAAKAQVTRDAPAWFHPGRSATLRLGPKIVLAHFGEVHPETLHALDVVGPRRRLRGVPRRAAAASARRRPARAALEAGDLLPVRRDFAFVLDARRGGRRCGQGRAGRRQEADRRRQRVRRVRGREPGRGQEVDRSRGDAAAQEKTLTDQEIEAVAARIVAAVGKATGGTIRK